MSCWQAFKPYKNQKFRFRLLHLSSEPWPASSFLCFQNHNNNNTYVQCCGEALKEPYHTRGHLKINTESIQNESIIIIGVVIIITRWNKWALLWAHFRKSNWRHAILRQGIIVFQIAWTNWIGESQPDWITYRLEFHVDRVGG